MDKLWLALAGAARDNAPTLEINHRRCRRWVENQTLAVSFATLCVDARSSTTTLRFRACSIP
jgi:cell division protein ZapE